MSTGNEAYQEAFWGVSCLYVCNGDFEKMDAVVPRPAGVSWQCYNKGNLNTYSAPNSRWQNVYFPGTEFDYTGAYDYGSYGWFDNEQNPNPIKYFNVIHCYKHPEVGETVGEILNIETVYYD